MTLTSAWRNVALLALCQALAMSGASLIATTSALVGNGLAENKAYATVPLALQYGATMVATIPAAHLMRQFGRRAACMGAAAVGMLGAALSTWAILVGNFHFFCASSAVTGIFYGFVIQFRFAAADVSEARDRSKAISWVLAGGVFAAVAGPNLARATRDWFDPILFAGCYFALVFVCAAVMVALSFVRIPTCSAEERRGDGRSMLEILKQPVCLTAVLCGPLSYAVMSTLMTATPLAMLACDHGFGDTAFVIQWHILGMYAPSFFTGALVSRFGVLNVMAAGSALFALCIVSNLSGNSVWHFWAGLTLLGVGWNFMFVGATTLLTESYRPSEKARVQGFNDFLVYGTVTVSALISGKLHHFIGWEALNIAAVPIVMATLLAGFWLRAKRAAQPA
jgi:MFS family permease